MAISMMPNQAFQAAQMQMMMTDQQMRLGFGNNGCGCWRPQYGYNESNWNLPNATVGQHGFLGLADTKGFGLDFNGSGRYEAGRDGVLAMDLNGDGRITPDEIQKSREMLKSYGGNFDLNGDGHVSPCERMRGQGLQRQMEERVGHSYEGGLDAYDLSRAGARVLVDGNRNGSFEPWEQHSVFNFPVPGQGRGRINFVDPSWGGGNSVHVNQPWYPRYY